MWLIWHGPFSNTTEPLQGLCLPLTTSELITLCLVNKFQLGSNISAIKIKKKKKKTSVTQKRKEGRKGRALKSKSKVKGWIERKTVSHQISVGVHLLWTVQTACFGNTGAWWDLFSLSLSVYFNRLDHDMCTSGCFSTSSRDLWSGLCSTTTWQSRQSRTHISNYRWHNFRF